MHAVIYKINNKDVLYSTGNYIQYLIRTYNEKGSEKEHIYIHTHTYICICMCVYNYITLLHTRHCDGDTEMSKTLILLSKGKQTSDFDSVG